MRSPYWGTRGELIEVLDLARDGVLDVEAERFSLDDGLEAYRRLAANDLQGGRSWSRTKTSGSRRLGGRRVGRWPPSR